MSPGVSVWLIYTQMWFIITIYDHISVVAVPEPALKLSSPRAHIYSKRMQICLVYQVLSIKVLYANASTPTVTRGHSVLTKGGVREIIPETYS